MFRSLCTMALLLTAAPVAAKSGGDTTWGKAGVSLPDYARDATECADATRGTQVAIKPRTLREMSALSSARLLQIVSTAQGSPDANALNYVSAWNSYQAADDIARRSNTYGGAYVATVRSDVVDELQTTLDQCLIGRGYQRIRLTTDQSKQLSHLKRNTAERTSYLHAIGSDAAIIERQRILPANTG